MGSVARFLLTISQRYDAAFIALFPRVYTLNQDL